MPSLTMGSAQRLTGGTGRIEGVVQDLATGTPLGGATVLIRPCSVQAGRTGRGPFLDWTPFFLTAPDGAFHLDGLPEGRFHIEAAADGYLQHHHSPLPDLHGRPGSRQSFDILWTYSHWSSWDEAWNELGASEPVLRNQYPRVSAGESVRIVVALRRGRVIHGHVRDLEGQPIAGATIKPSQERVPVERGCFDVNDLAPGTSDAQGAFQVCGFPGAGVELLVHAPGFAAVHHTAPPSSEDSVTVQLTPARSIRGRVLRADGRVARRTRVMIFNPTDLETALTTDVDDRGAWTIEAAPPPPFAVIAWHGYSGACWNTVREDTPELNLVLQPMRTVRGQVVEPDGRPVEDEFITQVFPFECGEGRTVQIDHTSRWDIGNLEKTDADGRFRVAAAPGVDGKVLLRFDYHSPPAEVDGSGEVRLVISEKEAESRALQRKFAPRRSEPESTTEATSPAATCSLPKTRQPDWSPADYESRNRLWIGLLQSEPASERAALLKQLREEIGGG